MSQVLTNLLYQIYIPDLTHYCHTFLNVKSYKVVLIYLKPLKRCYYIVCICYGITCILSKHNSFHFLTLDLLIIAYVVFFVI